MESISTLLADWSASVKWDAITSVDKKQVLNSIIDTVGVTIAGTQTTEFEDIDQFASLAYPTSSEEALVWGLGKYTSATQAALLNGTAGHIMDFDDIHYEIHGHASTVIVPAILAVAERQNLTLGDLFRAYIIGVGVMNAVSKLYGPKHYSAGWHSTSTCGAIGAAAAAATVLDLTTEKVAAAMSAAVSLASGIRANFGTPLKPLHAGLAARAGIEAALMTQAGISASLAALEGPLGAVDVFGDGSWPADYQEPEFAALTAAREGLKSLGIKLYPCCRGAHYAIDAALEVRQKLADTDQVQKIQVEVPLGSRTALIHDDPQTGLEAKFSLPYTVATSLAHGLPVPEHFENTSVHNEKTRNYMSSMSVIEDASQGDLSAGMEGRYARVTAVTTTGKEYSAYVDDARGSWTRPLTDAEVDGKFLVTASSLGEETSKKVLSFLRESPPEALFKDLVRIAQDQ